MAHPTVEAGGSSGSPGRGTPSNSSKEIPQQTLNAAEYMEDTDNTDNESQHDESSKAAKRLRTSEELVSCEVQHENRTQPPLRDDDGFMPGQIIHIELHQFLTYDHADFRPCPYLNMVTGPNGTGKSSIACAICIGLCFPVKLLDRAKDLKSFVKHNYGDGYTQITLKGRKGRPNIVIKRTLHAEDNKSLFTINGEHATAHQVQKRVKSLNIQVGNYCTFLPQDRVQWFARMTPIELLRQTQLAAGHPDLIGWHDKLIAESEDLKNTENRIRLDEALCEDEQRRNDRLKDQVDRYEARKALERRHDFLGICRVSKDYTVQDALARQFKANRNELMHQQQQHERMNKPLHDFKKDLEKQADASQNELGECKNVIRGIGRDLREAYNEDKKLQNQVQERDDELDDLRREYDEQQASIVQTRKDIEDVRAQLEIKHSLRQMLFRAARARVADAKNKFIDSEVTQKLKENAQATGTLEAQIEYTQQKLRELDSSSHQQLLQLARWDPGCADVVRWLRQNQSRFRRPIIEPAYLSVTVPDLKYAAAIEACINAAQMKTFVAQTKDDYMLFNRLVCDTPEALGKKMRVSTFFRPLEDSALLAPPLTTDEMQELRFDKYALECVQCPEPMKWFLQRDLQFHRIPIALVGSSVNVERAMDAVSRTERGGGANFIAGRVLNMVQRSRYGQRLPQNMTREFGDPRTFKRHTADPDTKRQLEVDIHEAELTLAQRETDRKALETEQSLMNNVIKELEKAEAAVEQRRKKLQETCSQIALLESKRDAFMAKLHRDENAPSTRQERKRLYQEKAKIEMMRAGGAKTYLTLSQKLIKEYNLAATLTLKGLQIKANLRKVEAMCQQESVEYARLGAEIERVDKLFKDAKKDAKNKLELARKKMDECPGDVMAEFKEVGAEVVASRSIEDIQQELADIDAQLDLNLATDPNVILEYETREAKIEQLQTSINSCKAQQDQSKKRIDETKGKWLPELDDLLRKVNSAFSSAFDRVGCAGEVKLGQEPPNDYSKWTIDIMVKFRDSEPLQRLTAQRQSGGERALATSMYLMSLTHVSRAPFSLVDEINQGMDEDYERAAHNSLVEMTCNPMSGQYFLATPKMLPDLAYHPLMKILCVYNGEWLPEPGQNGDMLSGNMMSWLDAYESNKHPNDLPSDTTQ